MMIDFWNIEESGIGDLLENIGHDAFSMSGSTILIISGICFLFLSGAIAIWSLHRTIKRSEESLTENLMQHIHDELLSQQESQLARIAIVASNGSLKHHADLMNGVDEGLEKRRNDEDKSMERLMTSMRRFKDQQLEIH